MSSSIVMEATILEEAGYWPALRGLSMNKKQGLDLDPMKLVAAKLCKQDGGHNKFLESIYVWLHVKAPRYWWQEADTYRISSKQSESTIHTLFDELDWIVKRANGTSEAAIHGKKQLIDRYVCYNFEAGSISTQQMTDMLQIVALKCPLWDLKKLVPEGFLQARLWCMNYKCLRNIILQRRNHRLPHWKIFIGSVLNQIGHPELLPTLEYGDQDGPEKQIGTPVEHTHTQEYGAGIPKGQTYNTYGLGSPDDKPIEGRDHLPEPE